MMGSETRADVASGAAKASGIGVIQVDEVSVRSSAKVAKAAISVHGRVASVHLVKVNAPCCRSIRRRVVSPKKSMTGGTVSSVLTAGEGIEGFERQGNGCDSDDGQGERCDQQKAKALSHANLLRLGSLWGTNVRVRKRKAIPQRRDIQQSQITL
jgi:hypothetical protein